MKKIYSSILIAVAATLAVSSASASMLSVTNKTVSCDVQLKLYGSAYGSKLTNALVYAAPNGGTTSISGVVINPGNYINFRVSAINPVDESTYVAGYAKITGMPTGQWDWTWIPGSNLVSGAITQDNFGNANVTITAASKCK